MSYLWKEEWQDNKADPVDNVGKLESIGDCREKNQEEHMRRCPGRLKSPLKLCDLWIWAP